VSKKQIHPEEFNRKLQKQYKKSKVEVRLGELELVMKAAKKCIRFAIMSDTFLGGGLAVEDEEMASAYKSMNEYLKKIKEKTRTNVEKELRKTFEVE
jgi:hypothetical protein